MGEEEGRSVRKPQRTLNMFSWLLFSTKGKSSLMELLWWNNGWKYYATNQMVGKSSHKPFLVTHRKDWTKSCRANEMHWTHLMESDPASYTAPASAGCLNG